MSDDTVPSYLYPHYATSVNFLLSSHFVFLSYSMCGREREGSAQFVVIVCKEASFYKRQEHGSYTCVCYF